MQQASDFLEECQVLDDALTGLGAADWQIVTQFKDWTIDDVLVHLHFWNQMADLSQRDPDAFQAWVQQVMPRIQAEGFRATENAAITERGHDLRAAWSDLCSRIGRDWSGLDPKSRVKWVGPDMSVRSSMTARQMETWAHGQEVFDILGLTRPETDRIRNIVVLGVNTFGWTYTVHGRPVPPVAPYLRLIAPSGALWEFGAPGADLIEGPAVDFARVVTQTRNVADTGLSVQGPVAQEWMVIAQCFAGAPETPPPPGARHRVGH
ncbi:TIGR03084 family metal-binding protein [Ruegeria arenilitoris]|uniref:TIGR03084 family metal-binding protein n=1 Tax=Ruegeria arenilitoris TaxID=1173585 RepID=UPI001479A1B1|nr:TIGR03084 family metal-binding protein [Ruegeria arenilitoris]